MKKLAFCIILMMSGIIFSQTTKSLFNGKDLNNWEFILSDDSKTPEEVFYVADGVMNITGFPNGYLRTTEKFQNFELTLEWRWVGNPANSGVLLSITGEDKVWPDCIEAQLQHGNAGDLVLIGIKPPSIENSQGNNRVVIISKQNDSSEKEPGEWNQYRIVLKNEKLEYYVNGVFQNSAEIVYPEGFIGLQSEGGHIQFRNILITY